MKLITIGLFLLMALSTSAQYSNETETTYVNGLFHGRHIVNGHSLETQREGELEFYIAHRFGTLNGGFYELFGLDQASMRMAFEYGINDRIAIGAGRSTFGKYFDGFAKVRLLRQSTGARKMPISMTAFSSVALKTLKPIDGLPLDFHSKLSYTHQLLIGRKFSDELSIQLMPTLTHLNLVDTRALKNDIFTIGTAVRYRLSLNIALTLEYYHTLPNQLAPDKRNSLAIGFDIDTGSHVFQLHLTNSTGMFEQAFLTETTGNWVDGGIHLGFNMNRIFKLKGRRY